MARVAPYGSWPSPITASVVAAQGLRLGYPSIDGADIYWLEGRPHEGGRNVLVQRSADGTIRDVTPVGTNVRTRVHEYGGGAYLVSGGSVFYSNFADQRVYRLPASGGDPMPLTPDRPWFFADYDIDRRRNRLVCVREDHADDAAPVNELVAITIDPVAGGGAEPVVLASGYDFYSTPRLSPDGTRLCWISWSHPNMPWDGTELWVADFDAAGALANAHRVAGGPRESIFQPGWSPDGDLVYVSDRTGYWQIYTAPSHPPSRAVPLVSARFGETGGFATSLREADFGRPQWLFGWACWAFAGPSRLVVSYTQGGRWHLGVVDLATGILTPIVPDLEPAEWLVVRDGTAVVIAGASTGPLAVVAIDLDAHPSSRRGAATELRSTSTFTVDAGSIAIAEAIEFPTSDGATAHAFFYAPRNADAVGPSAERPPLIVISHGGPTTATRAMLDLQIQFWTTRGFAVVDVNYRGSSGYGRAYREALNGQWGIADVADCVNAARCLVASDRVDGRRLIIRGGSAGGYTTLAALTFHPDVFRAGASYYGISDIEVLAHDTHKFEARYLDSLVGPYPQERDRYRARSPIHFVDRLSCPLILLQGLEDKVVPPNQARMMADAVKEKGLPVALLMFEGEQHGFRRADTIVRSLEAELYFYGVVFGLTPADRLPPLEIANT